jgi:hypothetical protein
MVIFRDGDECAVTNHNSARLAVVEMLSNGPAKWGASSTAKSAGMSGLREERGPNARPGTAEPVTKTATPALTYQANNKQKLGKPPTRGVRSSRSGAAERARVNVQRRLKDATRRLAGGANTLQGIQFDIEETMARQLPLSAPTLVVQKTMQVGRRASLSTVQWPPNGQQRETETKHGLRSTLGRVASTGGNTGLKEVLRLQFYNP